MDLKNYLKKNNLKPTPWAVENGLSPAVIHRYLKKKDYVLGTINALRIEQACNEEVTVNDLLARYKYTIAA